MTQNTYRTITVVGGNLFQIAAQYLNDATLWSVIAKFNGLWDPVLPSTPTTLKIPRVTSGGTGGILGV